MNRQDSPLKSLRTWLARTPEAGALGGFLFVFFVFALTTEHFLELSTGSTVLVKQVTSGIVAVGITVLMISGEFDLSVGSILAVSSLGFLYLISQNVPPPIAAIIGVLTGMTMGLINGLLLIWTRIPSFIVTLGTLQAYRAIALTGIGGGTVMRYYDYFDKLPLVYFHPGVLLVGSILVILFVVWLGFRIVPNYLRSISRSTGIAQVGSLIRLVFVSAAGLFIILAAASIGLRQFGDLNTLVPVGFFDILNGQIDLKSISPSLASTSFRMGVIWWMLIVAVFTIILSQTRYGNAVYATGGNAGAARAQGIPVDSIRVINFVISGGLAGLAGVIAVGRELSVFPLQAQGLELEVIAAAVIGGTLLSGGYGSVIGALLGVLITGMLSTGLVLKGIRAEFFQGAIGVILIITVVLNTAIRGQSSLINLKWLRSRTGQGNSKAKTPQENLEAVK